MKTIFKITNLSCEACIKLSNSVLSEIPGVVGSSVDLKTGLASVESDRGISMDEIETALKAVGKSIQPVK